MQNTKDTHLLSQTVADRNLVTIDSLRKLRPTNALSNGTLLSPYHVPFSNNTKRYRRMTDERNNVA